MKCQYLEADTSFCNCKSDHLQICDYAKINIAAGSGKEVRVQAAVSCKNFKEEKDKPDS